jgi:hypothetical protein
VPRGLTGLIARTAIAIAPKQCRQKEEFFASLMSGANRVPNGNTLICESVGGVIFEVKPDGKIVWKYFNPIGGSFKGGGGGECRAGGDKALGRPRDRRSNGPERG